MGAIYLPKTYDPSLEGKGIFLAGPIRGASNWQERAIDIIHNLDSTLWVASPRRDHSSRLINRATIGCKEFERQLPWEFYHLEKAGYDGCILFWLPTQTLPRKGGYARDTRREHGVWYTKKVYEPDKVRVVTGGEPAFEGIDVLERYTRLQLPDELIFNTLEATCIAAVEEARRR